jgi:imidazole glycerol phosphate synthase glutamine amidotransferase subunit
MTAGATGTREVVLLRTGIATLASVSAAFERLGARVIITTSPEVARAASHLVLPGVGAFGAGMAALGEHAIDEVLRERAAADRPLAAVCLGLQLLCDASEESPGVSGLGIVPGVVRRFVAPAGMRSGSGSAAFAGSRLRIPQLGWNRVTVAPGRPGDPPPRFLADGYAYYANSFRLAEAPPGWQVALTDYGGPFVGAMEKGALLACQFHPELSGPWGQALLGRWLEVT